MLQTLTLSGAYGRKYDSPEKALADWDAGKDFRINEMGCYCSARDMLAFRRQMYFVFITGKYPCGKNWSIHLTK